MFNDYWVYWIMWVSLSQTYQKWQPCEENCWWRMLIGTGEMNKMLPSEKSRKCWCQKGVWHIWYKQNRKNISGYFKIWNWRCTYTRWKVSCICFKVAYTNSTKICNHCICLSQVSSIHLWEKSAGWKCS